MGLEGLREHDKDAAPPSVATPRNGAAMALAGRRIAITGAAPREELRHGPDGGRP